MELIWRIQGHLSDSVAYPENWFLIFNIHFHEDINIGSLVSGFKAAS